MLLCVCHGSMAVFWCLPLTLLLLQRARSAADGTEVMGAVGGSVTFHLDNPPGESVAWSLYDDVKVVVNFGDPPGVMFFDSSYRQRLAFPSHGRALTISQLGMGDTGTYIAKASDVKTIFTLHVFKELEVPRVSCVAQNCSAGSCLYTLSCSVPGSGFGNISYSWSSGGLSRGEGPLVLLEEFLLEKVSPLTCTAQNPVSSHNVTVVLSGTLCAENTTHTPHTGTSSSRRAGIVATSVIGVILLLVVILLLYCKHKGWKISHFPVAKVTNTDGVEYATVYAQVGPSQQVSVHSLSTAEQEEQEKVLPPNVESSKTIYSTVQALAQTDDEKMGKGAPGCWHQDEKSLYASVGQPAPEAQPQLGSPASRSLL